MTIWRLKLTYIRTLARSNFNIQSLNESIPWDELQDEFFLSIVKVYPFFLERIIPVHNAEKIRDGGAPKPNGSPIARVTSLSRQKFQFLPSVTRKTDTSIRLGGWVTVRTGVLNWWTRLNVIMANTCNLLKAVFYIPLDYRRFGRLHLQNFNFNI